MDGPDIYLNPGKLFISRYGPANDGSSIARYADFLRRESGIDDHPPVDLARIYRHFGIPTPRRIPLPGQPGLLLNPESGIIFISANDPTTRQRFSEAHELMELLFAAQSPTQSWRSRGRSPFSAKAGESLCEEGAAELLMPLSTFAPYLHRWGVSLETGQRLAELYEVSLTAALLRTVRYGPGRHALVLWQLAWKPREVRSLPHPDQLPLFEDYVPEPPPKKLRVWWGCSTQGGPFIPRHKSVGLDTSIYRAYELESLVEDMDWVDLGNIRGCCLCESKTITIEAEKLVLSVIHLPKDEHSIP